MVTWPTSGDTRVRAGGVDAGVGVGARAGAGARRGWAKVYVDGVGSAKGPARAATWVDGWDAIRSDEEVKRRKGRGRTTLHAGVVCRGTYTRQAGRAPRS